MKRRISDVFDNLSTETSKIFSQYSAKENLDDVTRRRIYTQVMREINAKDSAKTTVQNSTRYKKKFNKVAIIAAACIAAMTLGGVTAGATKLYKSFTDYNPTYTEEQKAVVEKATFEINKQMGSDGVIVTVTEGLCDGNKLFLLANIEVDASKLTIPEGYTFYVPMMHLHMSGDPTDTNGFACIYQKVLETNGNVCTALYVYDMGDITDGQQLGLSGRGLIAISADGKESTELISHDTTVWGLKFNATKGSFAKAFKTDSTVDFRGYKASVIDGYISPWYAQFNLHVETKDDSILDNYDKGDNPEFKVVMKDGTVYDGVVGIELGGSASGNDELNYSADWDFHCSFKDYVDTANIDHVEINGVKVELKSVETTTYGVTE